MNQKTTLWTWMLTLLFSIQNLYGQCPGSLSCIEAPILCSPLDLNGLSCFTSNIPNPSFPLSTLCFGSGTPTNLNWWAFTSNGGTVKFTFNVNLGSCTMGNGIQAGVFEGNCDGNTWDCNADCNLSTFFLSGIVRQCEVYYLWVDGCDGDFCNYTLSATGSVQPASVFRPLRIVQDGMDCIGGETHFCIEREGCTNVDWMVDGILLTHGSCATVPTPAQKSYQICALAYIGDDRFTCDEELICIDYTPMVASHVGTLRVLCTRATPFLWHGLPITQSCISPPCSVRVTTESGCLVDSIAPFQILPPEIELGPPLFVPPAQQPFYWHGQLITHNCISPPCNARIDRGDGCLVDSLRAIHILTPAQDTSKIIGTVDLDLDTDCAYDRGEPPLSDIQITATGTNGTYQTLTDQAGRYRLVVPIGHYEVRAFQTQDSLYGCPIPANITTSDPTQSYTSDFYLPMTGCYTGQISFLGLSGVNRLRCDQGPKEIGLNITNLDYETLPVDTLIVSVDSLLIFTGASVDHFIISNTQIGLVIPEILGGQSKYLTLQFLMDCGPQNQGDDVCFLAQYLHGYMCNGRIVQTEYCSRIRNSFDPNDLTVTPFGQTDQRYISNAEELTGRIRFQNTGTDTAYDISIDLVLPLDMIESESFQLLHCSEENIQMSIVEDVVHFELKNVKLPHASIDSVGSNGYILYRLLPNRLLPAWSVIAQQAHIYFDQNPAIATNIEFHTIAGAYINRGREAIICQGDEVNNVKIWKDTTIIDTVDMNGLSYIYHIDVTVLPTYHFDVDTSILAGNVLHNVRITRDTVLDVHFLTKDGCDSSYTYRVDAITTGVKEYGEAVYLYPNPNTQGLVFVQGEVSQIQEVQMVHWSGRVFSIDQKKIQAGFFDVDLFPKGIYSYKILDKRGGEHMGQLVIQ